jgi:hypothetical protein
MIPLSQRVGELSRWMGRSWPTLLPGLAIVLTAVANEPGMAQAASNWKHGIAGRLDDGIKQVLPQLLDASRDGWVAQDQVEFERVVEQFHQEIGVLRGVLSDIGGILDEVAAGYRSFWLQIMGLLIATAALLALTDKLKADPRTALYGRILEKLVSVKANHRMAAITLVLGAAVSGAGETLATLTRKGHQFTFVDPVGQGRIDFKKATIDADAFPSFRKPAQPGRLPPGADHFDWKAPDTKG